VLTKISIDAIISKYTKHGSCFPLLIMLPIMVHQRWPHKL